MLMNRPTIHSDEDYQNVGINTSDLDDSMAVVERIFDVDDNSCVSLLVIAGVNISSLATSLSWNVNK